MHNKVQNKFQKSLFNVINCVLKEKDLRQPQKANTQPSGLTFTTKLK